MDHWFVSPCWLKKPDPFIGIQSISRFPQAACDSNSTNNTSLKEELTQCRPSRWLHVVENAMRGHSTIFSPLTHAAQQQNGFCSSAVFADMSCFWHYGCTWVFLVRNSSFAWALLRPRGHVPPNERDIAAYGRQVRSWGHYAGFIAHVA